MGASPRTSQLSRDHLVKNRLVWFDPEDVGIELDLTPPGSIGCEQGCRRSGRWFL
jgi:hypothetical protein